MPDDLDDLIEEIFADDWSDTEPVPKENTLFKIKTYVDSVWNSIVMLCSIKSKVVNV